MAIVVALGPVDAATVSNALGEAHQLVNNPTDAELAIAEGAIVRANFVVDKAQLDRMPALRVLARTGVGTERVDLVCAHERGIPVVITPGSNTNAVAEGALALILHLVKKLRPLTDLVREGRWKERDSLPLGDIEGATVGIVGWGRIGRRLGAILNAMGAEVLAFDPFTEVPAEHRVDSIEELLSRSKIVSLHVPLTLENQHLINAETLKLMQEGAVLVNCSRGPLIDLDAAFVALRSGKLAGLGLDVFDEEPARHHPIFEWPHVVLTPHVMGLSERAAAQTFHDAAVGVREVLAGRKPAATAN